MAQDKSEMIDTKGTVILEGGRIKPFDRVEVQWLENKLLKTKLGKREFMHPILAQKLIDKKLVTEPTAEFDDLEDGKPKDPKGKGGKNGK